MFSGSLSLYSVRLIRRSSGRVTVQIVKDSHVGDFSSSTMVVEENRLEEQSTVGTTTDDIEALVDVKSSSSFFIKSFISGLFTFPSV